MCMRSRPYPSDLWDRERDMLAPLLIHGDEPTAAQALGQCLILLAQLPGSCSLACHVASGVEGLSMQSSDASFIYGIRAGS